VATAPSFHRHVGLHEGDITIWDASSRMEQIHRQRVGTCMLTPCLLGQWAGPGCPGKGLHGPAYGSGCHLGQPCTMCLLSITCCWWCRCCSVVMQGVDTAMCTLSCCLLDVLPQAPLLHSCFVPGPAPAMAPVGPAGDAAGGLKSLRLDSCTPQHAAHGVWVVVASLLSVYTT
jgi:hypothetical protein